MVDETPDCASNFTDLAGGIVAAYVSHNPVPTAELPRLIHIVHSALLGLAFDRPMDVIDSTVGTEMPTPAEIRRSVRPDGIVSFIDGKAYKTLKRHLKVHGLYPQSYRERYGLPADYPMVAPSYAERRSALAKAIGLGVPSRRLSL
ncbi:MucR family transcriptional regulator (plasmid) [Methylobacterium sp. NMS12]|uniref:MucR family transcriptional regulator n=1 Tax=Methylobacterium sp. NMS12 TaxID=3079766 RepID=UPI003F881A58